MKYVTFLTRIVIIPLLAISTCTYPSQAVSLIDSFKVDGSSVHIDINKDFAQRYLKESHFFVTYDNSVNLAKVPYSIATIPFITNVIAIVWISGKRYTIPKMDRRLCAALGKIREIFKRLYPRTSWNGELVPESCVTDEPITEPVDPAKIAALLFSGGIDSTSSAYELQAKNLKLLLIMMRGQGASILTDDDRWNKQSTLGVEFAKEYGHDIAFLTSNYHRFLNHRYLASLSPEVNDWRVDAIEDVGMFGMTAPLLFSKGIQLLYMASSRDWSYPLISVGNPLVDSLMSCGNDIRLECSQFNFSRADKIAYIISQVRGGLKPPLIHVCYRGKFPGCTSVECRKCIPTALAFFALGEDPRTFGFEVSDEELVECAKEFLTKTQPHMTLWQLKKLQEMLREKKSSDEKLSWFLETDLGAHVNKGYITGKPSLTWEDLRDLAPETLEIPNVKIMMLVPIGRDSE